MNTTQIDLFDHVTDAFSQPHDERLTNRDVYRIAAGRAGISQAELDEPRAFGKAGSVRSEMKHRMRWILNSLKTSGVIHACRRRAWRVALPSGSAMRQGLTWRYLDCDCPSVTRKFRDAPHACYCKRYVRFSLTRK